MFVSNPEPGAYSTCKGVRIRSALTTFRDLNSGQAIITNPEWHLIVRTPYTNTQDLREVPQGLVGSVIGPHKSIGTITNNLNKPIHIHEVEVRESLSTAQSYEVKVKGYSYHREYSPKLRGPAIKASATPDVTGSKEGLIKAILDLDSSVEVIFPAETIKGAVVSLKAFADTVLYERGEELVITDGTVPESVLREHDQWVESNLKTIRVSHKIHPSVKYLYEGLDFELVDCGDHVVVYQDIEVLICNLILEVEAQPTALRATRSKLCCNQVISLLQAEHNKPEHLKDVQFDFFNTRDAQLTRKGLEAFVTMLEYNLGMV